MWNSSTTPVCCRLLTQRMVASENGKLFGFSVLIYQNVKMLPFLMVEIHCLVERRRVLLRLLQSTQSAAHGCEFAACSPSKKSLCDVRCRNCCDLETTASLSCNWSLSALSCFCYSFFHASWAQKCSLTKPWLCSKLVLVLLII